MVSYLKFSEHEQHTSIRALLGITSTTCTRFSKLNPTAYTMYTFTAMVFSTAQLPPLLY